MLGDARRGGRKAEGREVGRDIEGSKKRGRGRQKGGKWGGLLRVLERGGEGRR